MDFFRKMKTLQIERKNLECEIRNTRIQLSQINQQIELMRNNCPVSHANIHFQKCYTCGKACYDDTCFIK